MRKTETSVQPPNAKVGMPHMPSMYTSQHKKKFLPWSHAEERLIKSRSYWICTTRPDGRPHSIPVWGMWVEAAFYFGTGRETRKAKNIAKNPKVSVHLESGDDVVILEGKVVEADVSEKKLRAKLDAESKRKYKMPMVVMAESICYRVRPRVVLAWLEKEFPYNSTRWEFEE
jgi:nitroimidazol reductase NimA-like FMN-containing flavoprotein (pyridoxamine 5'-phosphate oxidase superfamily)